MKSMNDLLQKKPWLGWVIFFATVTITFILGVFASSILEHRAQSQVLFQLNTPIPKWETRSEKWGENFPRQYDRWKETSDTSFKSKYNGNAPQDELEKHPLMVVLWAGYAFSRQYDQARGHYYAIQDIRNNLRTGVPQPGTCWTCKSPDVVRMMNEMGVEKFYSAKWDQLGSEIVNPIGCLDCHNPVTMDVQITRPALVEAYQRMGKDIKQVSQQEKRSLVCAQCHVEYFFQGTNKYLTFPWDKGITVESMEEYYDSIDHVDWVHSLSKAPMLKAQHPDWELFQTGIHAQRGLACADCHMPYRREGGVKFTDHKVQSPLDNIENVCMVCHRETVEDLRNSVYTRQDSILESRMYAENTLARAHIMAKEAWAKGATEDEMKPILTLIRHAQWRWDFVSASHGGSFHSPVEAGRILGSSIHKANQAVEQLTRVLMVHGVMEPIQLPDLSTKALAQQYIGLDMEKLTADKEAFLQNEIPKWNQAAFERNKKWDTEWYPSGATH